MASGCWGWGAERVGELGAGPGDCPLWRALCRPHSGRRCRLPEWMEQEPPALTLANRHGHASPCKNRQKQNEKGFGGPRGASRIPGCVGCVSACPCPPSPPRPHLPVLAPRPTPAPELPFRRPGPQPCPARLALRGGRHTAPPPARGPPWPPPPPEPRFSAASGRSPIDRWTPAGSALFPEESCQEDNAEVRRQHEAD